MDQVTHAGPPNGKQKADSPTMAQQATIASADHELIKQQQENPGDEEDIGSPSCTDRPVMAVTKLGQFLWDQLTSNLGLFLLLMIYSFAGGGIMYGVEQYFSGDHEACINLSATEAFDSFHDYYVNITLEKHRDIITGAELHRILLRFDLEKRKHERCMEVPDYWDWVLFCLTVYTTIGYGSVHPKSRPGRIATMFYATIGVPLFLLTMSKLGKVFTRIVKHILSYLRKLFYAPQLECLRKNKILEKLKGNLQDESPAPPQTVRTVRRRVSRQASRPASAHPSCQTSRQEGGENTSYLSYDVDDEFDLHPLIAIIITLIYILLGSAMYVIWEEDWAYYDAFYFVFISISTIGFGDVVPKHPRFFLLSSIYILFGLALVAMVIDVLIEFYTTTYEVVAETLPEILHSDDDDSENSKDVRAGLEQFAVNFQPHVEEDSPTAEA